MNMIRVLVDNGNGDIITALVTDEAFKILDTEVGEELEFHKDSGILTVKYCTNFFQGQEPE